VSAAVALLAIALAMAVITTGSSARRRVGLGVAACAFLTPALAPDAAPLGRGALALGAVWVFARAIDLVGDRRGWSLGRRVSLALAVFDAREAARAPARFDHGAALLLLGYGLLGLAALFGSTRGADAVSEPARWLVRWGLGLVFVYAVPDAVAALWRLAFALLGVRLPGLHHAPIASRSLAEFWGRRWNRVVGDWLRRHCFVPVARRFGPAAGLGAAFVVSAALHGWLAAVALGWADAAMMGGYFLLQGLLVGVEGRLRLRGLRARAFALLAAGLPSPLFVEPVLRVFAPVADGLGRGGWV
jgi:hypothetical protein